MYIRETSNTLADGTKVKYVQLCHNYWDSEAQVSKTEVLYSFGRKDKLDAETVRNLIDSLSKLIEPEDIPEHTGKLDSIKDFAYKSSKSVGGSWVLDELWSDFSFDDIIESMLEERNYEVSIERLIFAMVANRALNPSSKLAMEEWVEKDVFIEDLNSVDSHKLYRAMDFLHEVNEKLEYKIFDKLCHLFNMEVDLLYFDTTSSYYEIEEPEDEHDLRQFGYSKDKRPDRPQVVIGLAVTREGIPIRSWTWPGNQDDMSLIEEVKDDLRGWNLGRVITVCDRGFASEDNRSYLQRAGGHYIMGEKLRSSKEEVQKAMSRPGRYKKVNDKLHIKEVIVGDGEARDRYVLAKNPDEEKKDRQKREEIVSELKEILSSLKQGDENHTKKMCDLRSHPLYGRYLRQLKDGTLKLDKGQIREDARYDGKYLIKTSDDTLDPEDVALGYKQLIDIEDAFRTIKSDLEIRPMYHRREDRIRAHIKLCWLALLLVRIIENKTDQSWRRVRKKLSRLRVGEFIFNSGTAKIVSDPNPHQLEILNALGIEGPPKYLDMKPDQ